MKNRFRYFNLLVFGLIGYGIFLRLFNYFEPPSLWVDEVAQAVRIGSDGGFERFVSAPTFHRPFLYTLACERLFQISNIEVVLRSTSMIFSIATLFVQYFFLRSFFRSPGVIFVGTFLTSVNPYLIRFATEFKPYSLEIFLTLVTLFAFTRYITSYKNHIWLALSLITGIAFTLAAIFITPPILLYLLWDAKIRRNRNLLLTVLLVAAVFIIGYGLQYYFLFSHISLNPYSTAISSPGVLWFLQGLISFINQIQPFSILDYGTRGESIFTARGESTFTAFLNLSLWGGLIFYSLIKLFHAKRFNLIAIILSPYIIIFILGVMGRWPFGAHRSNLFLLPFLIFLACVGLQFLADQIRESRFAIVVVVLFLLYLPWNIDALTTLKRQEIRPALAYVAKTVQALPQTRNKIPLYINAAGKDAFTYYTKMHDQLSPVYGPLFTNSFSVNVYQARDDEYLLKKTRSVLADNQGKSSVWFLLYHDRPDKGEFKLIENTFSNGASLQERITFPGVLLLQYTVPSS